MEKYLNPELEKLVVLNLKYSTRERVLNMYVFADFSLKALYQITSALPKSKRNSKIPLVKLNSALGQLLDISKLPTGTIKKALIQLKKDKKITGSHVDGWKLTTSTYRDIQEKLSLEEAFLRQVLKRHFPEDIKMSTLKKWFYETSSHLFGNFGDAMVANITGTSSSSLERINLEKIIAKTAGTYGQASKKKALLLGYENLITSDNRDDYKLIMDLAIRWFGARLVKANIGKDPVTLDAIKGSKFILDTNVLISIALGRRVFSKSNEALGKGLSEVGAELVYLAETRNEYTYTVDRSAEYAEKLFGTYDVQLIKDVGIDDSFIEAALISGCKDKDEIMEFYVVAREVPKRILNGPKITKDEDEQIESVVEKAKTDNKLKALIKTTKLELYDKEVSEHSLKHDASLLRVAEFLSADEKRNVWVLSLDSGLKQTSVKIAGADIPKVMGVETLIEFLALGGIGKNTTITDFAPLMANILKKHCMPFDGQQIQPKDLIDLATVIRDAAHFPAESLRKMAQVVIKARQEDKSIEDGDVQSQLIKLQGKQYEKFANQVSDAEVKTAKANKRRLAVENRLSEEEKLRKKIQEDAISDRATIIKHTVVLKLLKSILARAAIVFIIYIAVNQFSDNIFRKDLSGYELVLIIVALASWGSWLIKPIKIFSASYPDAERRAIREIEKRKF